MRNIRIMIAEDDRVQVLLLKKLFSNQKVDITVAENGLKARDLLKKIQFDLVLLDVSMPGLDGISLCSWIRKRRSAHELPVIFITSNNDPATLQKCFDCGGNDYVAKPINPYELRIRVKAQCRLVEAHEAILHSQMSVQDRHQAEQLRFFSQGLAHNLNNLFAKIMTCSNLLENKYRRKSALVEHLVRITQTAEQGGKLVQALLSFSGFLNDSGEARCMNPDLILEQTLDMFKSSHQNIDFNLLWQNDILPLAIKPSELRKIIFELVKNSVAAIGANTVRRIDVTAQRSTVQQNIKPGFCFSITDTGSGMNQETLDKLCRPFSGGQNSCLETNISLKSFGLGLAICRGILEQRGGTLEIKYSDRRGTQIDFTIPLLEKAQQDDYDRGGVGKLT